MVSIDVKVDYLQCCIADCCKFTIVESVVKFVGKFPEDGYLLLIETENYIDASTIERMRGEILGEADLLERAKHYGKSTKLVLFYVVTYMLWSSESLGWPLKHFVGLDKHLEKAKSLSQMVSSTFYEYVCFEAEFLFDQSSSFSNSILHFRRAQKLKNVSSEIFAARSILEALLKEEKFEVDSKGVFRKQIGVLESSIFQCRVSIQVLMFFWNFWKGRMLSMISFVKSLGSINKSQYESYGNLCMEHFGVIKLDGLDMFIAVNGEASWLKGKDEENFSQLGNKVYMSGLVFKSLAERVLKSEICSMAVRVFEKLKWLLMYSRPKLSFIQRAVLALQLYGISVFLGGFNVGVGGSLGLSEQDLLSAFSPLYFEKYMISDQSGANLQDKDAAVRALGTILHENLKYFRDGSRPTKTGWALLLVLTSKQLIEELTWEVRHNSGPNSPWRKFFEQLVDYMRKGYEDPSSLASTFLDAVKHADPQCQLLLIECLLFLGSSCRIGRVWFLTSKFTLTDSVFSQESEAYWCALSALPQWFDAQSVNCFFDFILAVVDGLMSPCSDHRHPRLNWYKKSELKSFQFHQFLVLRLVTVAGLICLNSKEHFSKVQELLSNFCGLLSVLPHRFLVQLWGVKKGRTRTTKCFAHAFAKALETVGNQLVVVHTGNWNNSFMHMKPLIRECNLFQHRKGGNKIPVMVKERLNLVKCKYFPI
uniref:Uncharacterized protein n=1 Tax=Nelumbo nucifera TaxID=4432 RepID=A0A822YNN8_NELNU|nr:TPA_asm: hypothetical protein HUJ06_011456 [Nelumbo nucifera]